MRSIRIPTDRHQSEQNKIGIKIPRVPPSSKGIENVPSSFEAEIHSSSELGKAQCPPFFVW